jgi:hypothetical protein
VSPILVRPVREQLEHDRLIRLLQTKFKRKFDAAINPGVEQNAPVGVGPTAVFPDLVLFSLERSRRLEGVIEVETGESVNHLEALSQWTHLARLRVPFHLYVPVGMVDVARRLAEDNQIIVSEIWSYHMLGDQVRFALVHRSREVAPAPKAKVAKAPVVVAKSAVKIAVKKAPAKAAKAKPAAKAVKKAPKAKAKAKPAKPAKAKKKPKRK